VAAEEPAPRIVGTVPLRRLLVALTFVLVGLAGAVAATAAVQPGHDDADPPVATAPETTTTTAPTAPTAPATEPPTEPATEPDPDDAGLLVHPAPAVYAAAAPEAPSTAPAPRTHTVAHHSHPAARPAPQPLPSAGVLWLNEPLPDPTPASLRLRAALARRLLVTSRAKGLDWALVLAVLRTREQLGLRGAEALLSGVQVPAFPRPSMGWDPAVEAARTRRDRYRETLGRISNDTAFVERAAALALYYRAVGVRALRTGLEAAKPRLTARLLRDPRIQIYPGGRGDLAAARIDVRVLAVIAYLTATYGQLTVTSLESGHRLYARPGAISAHALGRAVDVSMVAGVAIEGHQQPDGIAADAVRAILLLPAELQAKQVISLLGLGGPSFPLADHYDHIHVGY
jgi:hypothetical protein